MDHASGQRQIPESRVSDDELIARAQDLLRNPDIQIQNQHIVSRSLLRQWTTPQRPGRLMALRRDVRKVSETGLSKAGVEDNYLPVGSGTAELLWKEVEDKIPNALRALQAPAPLNPEHEAVMKDVLALHYVRSAAHRDVANRVWDEVLTTHYERFDAMSQVELDSQARNAGLSSTPSARDLAELLARGIGHLIETGAWRRVRVEDHFDRIRGYFAQYELGILSSPRHDLIIGDTPVLTGRPHHTSVGLRAGVPIGDASYVAMPVGPHHYIELLRNRASEELTTAKVNKLNALQLSCAHSRVFFRSDETLGKYVRGLAKKVPPRAVMKCV